VSCLQADLLDLPFADASFDFVYSLGVLHHLEDTERALEGLVRLVKPGGRLRVYLYWKRHGWPGILLQGVTLARRVTTRLPFGILRAFCAVLSAGLYGGIVLPYRAFASLGLRIDHLPLFVYTKYPFTVLYNDQFDRFSAPIEKRYDAEEVRELLEAAGLRHVHVQPCFGWVAEGVRPA
jgi:SAM-dependent methyltransferase